MLPLRARMNLGVIAVKGYPHSPKLRHYWSLTIRLFSVISRTLVSGGGGLTPLQRSSRCILQPKLTGQECNIKININHPHRNRTEGMQYKKEYICGYLCFWFHYKLLTTVVQGDHKAPFSIATTLWCRGGCYSFPWIAPLYPWYVPYIVECYASRDNVPFFESLIWRDLGWNPGLLDHWQTLYPLHLFLIYYFMSARMCICVNSVFFKSNENV